MQYRITAPVHGHSGVVAGITFADGVATCCDPPLGAIEYFRRHGYEIVPVDAPDAVAVVVDDKPTAVVTEDASSPKPAPRARSKQRSADSDGG